LNSYGQQIEKCDSTKSYWIIESGNTNYTLKIPGTVSTTERKNVISVNNKALQYVVVEKKNYIIEGKTSTELEILANYVSNEVSYISRQFKTKLEAQMQKAPLSNEKDVVIWWYKMPDGMNEQVSNQLFVSIIIGDKIFGVASPQFTYQKFEEVRDFLMDIISTLKNVDKKKDLKNICG
jgi:hypothetical protein